MVAKRYSTLPSQALKQGNTIDVKCALLSMQYENYLNKKASDESNGKKDHSPEELQAMIDRVKEKKNK